MSVVSSVSVHILVSVQQSSARCGPSVQSWESYPGEREMQIAPLYPQMSSLDSTEPLWCERTQDMSGYVLPATTSLPLDEQFQLNFSTAPTEHDFDLQNSGNSSPEEFLLRDQTKVYGEDSITFDNSNYSELHTKMKSWLPKISAMEINELVKTNMISDNGCFSSRTDSENSQTFPQPPKEESRPSATDAKHRHLSSIFDCEEPYIKEDQDILSSFCNDSKLTFDKLRDEIEVAEEVVVTTEVLDESKSKMFLGSFFFDSASPEYQVESKEEVMLPSETKEEMSSPLGGFSLMETTFDLDSASPEYFIDSKEEVMLPSESKEEMSSPLGGFSLMETTFDLDSASPEYLIDSKEVMLLSENKEDISSPLSGSSLMETTFDFDSVFTEEDDLYSLDSEPTFPVRLHPLLRLNIEAANQLNCGGLPDTPEVLKPVLKPEAEFDLVNYLMTNGDSNNNRLPTTPVSARPRPCLQRRGKSHLSIADLRECHKYGRGKPSPSRSPSPSPSCSSGRPARRSATKFKRLLEEGLLDTGSMSAEDEDTERRSISSTSSRKRLHSDSDMSSVGVGENSTRYRERRDRNNLSSKRSRQKRKQQQEQKKVELTDLEDRNKRLRRKADQLAAVLDRVHKAWKEYLEKMKKD
uniref:BZIP domain-containing protein n=2 Tax=Graphocephala atropunctata TaxID=36148 RepID=A0A1B6MCX7_9HEMI